MSTAAAQRAMLLLALAVAACRGEPPEAASENPANGPFRHLVPNSLEAGSDPINCMLDYPLTAEGMAANEPLMEVMGSPASQEFLSYIISCALPADQGIEMSLEGDQEVSFPGLMGVAPEWADGPCDQECQEWVSACLIGRINFYPVHVQLYSSGPQVESGMAAPPPAGSSVPPMEEGAFYGNFFSDPPQLYGCRGRSVDPFYRTIRLCTQPGSPCGIQSVGPCGEIDGNTGLPSARRACESFDETGQFYERCYNVASDENGVFPEDARVFTRVMTVHLPHSNFMPDAEQCFD